jgi:hypothetical protein
MSRTMTVRGNADQDVLAGGASAVGGCPPAFSLSPISEKTSLPQGYNLTRLFVRKDKALHYWTTVTGSTGLSRLTEAEARADAWEHSHAVQRRAS